MVRIFLPINPDVQLPANISYNIIYLQLLPNTNKNTQLETAKLHFLLGLYTFLHNTITLSPLYGFDILEIIGSLNHKSHNFTEIKGNVLYSITLKLHSFSSLINVATVYANICIKEA